MDEFKPPVSERDTDELLIIVYGESDKWEEKLISVAKNELNKRGISLDEQKAFKNQWKTKEHERNLAKARKLEQNKTESFEIWEIVLLFIFGPYIFFSPVFGNSYTMYSMIKDKKYLKVKQKLIIYSLSFFVWIMWFNYDSKNIERKRIEEIEKIDTSDWEKEFGYD